MSCRFTWQHWCHPKNSAGFVISLGLFFYLVYLVSVLFSSPSINLGRHSTGNWRFVNMQNRPIYKLRCTLPGHSKDVRCVAIGSFDSENSFVSGSRDKTAKLWTPEGMGFVSCQTYGGHEGYVSAVAAMPVTGEHPQGAVVTGCQDGKIRIFHPYSSSPSQTLVGHTESVCSIGVMGGFLISGSWDKTARVWRNEASVLVLSGHAAAIWAVAFLGPPTDSVNDMTLLTASADKTVQMWRGNTSVRTYKGHTDCVRALAVCPDRQRFLSAANDATIRLWAVAGQSLATFYGHSNYIYSLCLMKNGTSFASCGEDRSLRVWNLDAPDECQQTVFLPAQSVWTVAVMDNNDIVTGSSDGLVRVFTYDADRVADAETLKAYEEELSATTLNAQQELGGIKLSDLPGPESLLEPGRREGQTKLVRQGASVMCYSWSSSAGQWSKVGDVMGAAGGTEATKTLHQGKEYDFVFSIDIEEGQVALKLPYNRDQDPWLVAQNFIHEHDLSQYYLETVANFIINNSGGGAQKPSTNAASGSDPLTGGSRYVPGSAAPLAAGGGGGSGASAGGYDPFTGAARYVPASAGAAPAASTATTTHSFFPVRQFLRFDQANLDAISNKLNEFNGKVGEGVRLTEVELRQFAQLAAQKVDDVTALIHLEKLLQWPAENLIPVLDILRLGSRHASVYQFLVHHPSHLELLLGLTRTSVPNCMLVYRIFAHLVAHHSNDATILQYRQALLDTSVAALVDSDVSFTKHGQWKNVQIAVATLLLNLAVQQASSSPELEVKSSLVVAIGQVVTKVQEEEALFRVLAAAGTALNDDDEALAVAQSLDLHASMEHLTKVPGKVGQCAQHVLARLA